MHGWLKRLRTSDTPAIAMIALPLYSKMLISARKAQQEREVDQLSLRSTEAADRGRMDEERFPLLPLLIISLRGDVFGQATYA